MATVKVKVPTSIDSPTPWTLPRTKLICVNINGSEHDAFLCKAGNKAYGLPDGFATGALLNLNTKDLGEVKRFIEAYGLPVSPYANQFELVEKRFISNDKFSNDPVGDGLDCWSDSLNASTRSSDIIETLGFSLFNHYKGKDSSAGTEIANLIKGIRKKDEQIILTEDLATTLTIMQVAALLFSCKAAFGPKAYDKAIPLLKKLPNSDKIKKKVCQLFTTFQMPTKIYLDTNESELPLGILAARVSASHNLESIEKQLAAFLDLSISPYPEETHLIQNSTLRRIASISLESRKQPVGSLTRAFSIQLLEYLQSDQPWRICDLCKRPYKIRQQTMHALTSAEAAQKELSKPRRKTNKQSSFCTKTHEERERRKVQAEKRDQRKIDRKLHELDTKKCRKAQL